MTSAEPVVVVEVAAPVIEATAMVVAVKEPEMEAAKASSQKCEKISMKCKTKITSLHPPYFDMIKDAISSLKDKTGSSQYAIAKFIEEKQKNLPRIFKKVLLIQLKRLVTTGKLVKVKSSYKLPTASTQMKKLPGAKPNAFAKPKSPVKKEPVRKPSIKPKSASKVDVVAKPKAIPIIKEKTLAPKAVAKLDAKVTPKTPTKQTKVARTSTQRKKPTPARKSFKVTKKSTLRKVSSMIATTSAKMVELKSVKTMSATLKKPPTTRKIEKKM